MNLLIPHWFLLNVLFVMAGELFPSKELPVMPAKVKGLS